MEYNTACHPHTWPLDAFGGLLVQSAGIFLICYAKVFSLFLQEDFSEKGAF